VTDHAGLAALFAGKPNAALVGRDAELWARCQAAHRGHQLGLELLLLVPQIGIRSGFLELTVNEELQPVVPERFTDAGAQTHLTRALAPPPAAAADEIVTPMGGTFYAREAPHLPPLVDEGDHFEVGQPLFVIEVMKMFNKVLAPFSGTVVKNLMRDMDGHVVKKGQVIFRIEPDERLSTESPESAAARRRATTLSLLA
jgi:biotin carboxyl carrier protein